MIRGTILTKNYSRFSITDSENNTVFQFEGAKLANPALHGDMVELVTEPTHSISVIKRGQHPILAGLLDLKSRTKYGMTSRNVPIYLFYPFDKRYPPFRVGCSEKDVTQNRLALVEFSDFTKSDIFPRGNLVRLIGVSGDLDAEKEALAHTVSPYCKTEGKLSSSILSSMLPTRDSEYHSHQLIDEGYMTVNIDPEGCKDIDDAVSFKLLKCGSWDCIISIADVDAVVREGSPIDEYAKSTLQTVYDSGHPVKPMLPPIISESMCSLVPGSPKQVVSLTFKYVPSNLIGNRIVNIQFKHLHLVNKKSYSYENVYAADDFPVTILQEVASEMAGEPITDSHEWVAQCMKFYNLRAAAALGSQGIYRAHKGPVKEKLDALMGIQETLNSIDPTIFQSLSNSAASYALLGADVSDISHHGFDGQLYCHATSPIRRYADLHNQRILKKIIHRTPIESHVDPIVVYKLNEVSKASKNYDRICTFLKEISIGDSVEAIIISKSTSKLQVFIFSWRMTFNLPASVSSEEPGSRIALKYFFDASKKSWKERMVFNQV
jgi:exoribonuclease R